MRVLGLDATIPSRDVYNVEFPSSDSVFDFDAVIWNPSVTLRRYSELYTQRYQGLPLVGEHGSTRLLKDIGRRKREFKEFLEMGRTIIVVGNEPSPLFYDTGKRETSGTGRNRAVTIQVAEIDLLAVLPYELKATVAAGEEIAAVDDRFSALLRKYQGWWSYCAVLDQFPGVPLAVVVGTRKVVASINKQPNGATIIHLPESPLFDPDEYEAERNLAQRAEEAEPSESAEIVEEEVRDTEDDTDELASELMSWIKNNSGVELSSLPDWLENMQFQEDIPRVSALREIEAKISSLQDSLSVVQEERAVDNRWKHLVVGSGDTLEVVVGEAFDVLGFEILEKIAGRRDLRLKSGDSYAVVEIKGVSKSAAEANAAQLEKWVNEAFIDHEIHHKGILVVNTWRNTPLSDRREIDFPDQMLPYSIARSHVLMTGLQLLSMVRAVLAGRVEASQLRQEILNQSGPVIGWTDLTEIFGQSDVRVTEHEDAGDRD